MNGLPVLALNSCSSGLPQRGQASPISMPRSAGMSVCAFASAALNGPQNSSSTSS